MRDLLVLATVVGLAALGSAGSIIILRPWLNRHLLVHPNARSSHQQPTPQGGGIAIVVTTLAVAWGAAALLPAFSHNRGVPFLVPSAAAVLLAVVGAVDDIRALPTVPRFALQCLAVGALIAVLPTEWHILPVLPWWVERLCLFVGCVWFVNLVNFMDGIDWMTVAEGVPLTGAIVLFGLLGVIGILPAIAAAALLGAILGFAPFNKPVAKLFLGDVGSLPIGLLLGWLLLELAGRGHPAAAIILPLYYLADTTLTLVRRIAAGKPFWQAHRTHFYQRATDNGFTVADVVGRVFVVNLALLILALVTVLADSIIVSGLALAAAAAIVGWLLAAFARGKR